MNAKFLAAVVFLLILGVGGAAIYWIVDAGNEPPDSSGGNEEIADFEPANLKPLVAGDIVTDSVFKAEVVKNQVLVTMHDGRSRGDLQKILDVVAPNSQIVGSVPTVNLYQVEVADNQMHAIASKLDNHPWVVGATLNVVRRPTKSFNDPFISDQEKGWGIRRINAESAWDKTTGKNVEVAIVDSGTRTTHEEIDGKTIESYSYATKSGEMQIKEYYMMRRNEQNQIEYFIDYVAGHGTHVTGTASGKANNSTGTAGIAPDAKIMPIQVLYFVSLNRRYKDRDVGYVSGSTAEIVAGITRAIAKGADVVNLSLGPSYDPETIQDYVNGDDQTRQKIEREVFIPRRTSDLKAYKKVLDLAKKQNVILVNAAGNDNIPAEFDAFCYSQRMISVAATDPNDQRASFSNYGKFTTVSAPGVDIHSSYSKSDDAYTKMPGTSMACPHVAGTVALMKSVYPKLTFEQARDVLRKTGTKLNTDKEIGPLIDAAGAIAETLRIRDEKEEPPVDEPPMIEQPQPPVEDQPDQPTPEEIVNGPTPWTNPQVQNLIDLWLSIATPPLEPVDGRPWFYDEWARMLNNYTAFAFIPPDHGGLTRHQYVWQFAKELKSVRHGTLYEFVLGMLRDGSFNPAPIKVPGGPGNPKPGNPDNNNPNPGNQNPGNPDPGNPGDENPADQLNPQLYSLGSLKGQWRGKNGQGTEIGLNIFDDQSVWLIRDGVPVAYRPNMNLEKLPVIMELSQDEKLRIKIAVQRTGDNSLKVATYFRSSLPKFAENDQYYTYELDRIDSGTGETNIARFGYQQAKMKLHSTETVLVGSSRMPGIGFEMPASYKVVRSELSRDGNTAWVVIDNRYPAKGTEREPQVWSVDTRTGQAQRSALDTTKMSISEICVTPDGKTCWAVVDYSLPAAVQARREFKMFKATVGQPFTLMADTNSNDKIASLGLSQYYDPHVSPDGSSLIFNDRRALWRTSGGSFSKIIERDQINIGSLTIKGNASLSSVKVSGDGTKWIGTLVLYRDNKAVNTVVYGDMSGSGKVIAVADKLLGYPNISFDGSKISYFDYATYKAMVGTPGNMRAMESAGKYHTYDPAFFDNGSRAYGVIGRRGTSTVIFGFFEDLGSSKRSFSHSGLLLPPNPGAMHVSNAGDLLVGTYQGSELIKAELGARCIINGHPEIEEVLYQIKDGRLHCRFKVKNAEEIGTAGIMYMHDDYVPSGHVIEHKDNAFSSWARFGSARANKSHNGYFDVNTPIKDGSIEELKSATFVIALRSKTKDRVSNYIVKME